MAVSLTRKAVALTCFAMLLSQNHAAMAQTSQPAGASAPITQQTFAKQNIISRRAANRTIPSTRLAPSSDGFVLLNNDNVLRGNAAQHGNEIVISRGDGTELSINRERVRCWANSLEALYRFRIANRNAQDLNAFVTDIRWSIRNGLMAPNLLQHAKTDLKHASKLAPGQPTLERLAQEVRRHEAIVVAAKSASKTRSTGHATAHPETIPRPIRLQPDRLASRQSRQAKEIQQVDHQRTEATRSQEIDPQTLATFTRDVQPMLLNRCGGCHGMPLQRDWKLMVPSKGSRSSARMTRENFLALSHYLNFDDGLESELRIRAMDGHAGKRNSLGLRETASSRAFDQWLQLAKRPGAALDIAKHELASVETQSAEFKAEIAPAATENDASRRAEAWGKKNAAMERLPQVNNPFDPEIFNRRQQLR